MKVETFPCAVALTRAVFFGPDQERHPYKQYKLTRQALERSAGGGPKHSPIQNPD